MLNQILVKEPGTIRLLASSPACAAFASEYSSSSCFLSPRTLNGLSTTTFAPVRAAAQAQDVRSRLLHSRAGWKERELVVVGESREQHDRKRIGNGQPRELLKESQHSCCISAAVFTLAGSLHAKERVRQDGAPLGWTRSYKTTTTILYTHRRRRRRELLRVCTRASSPGCLSRRRGLDDREKREKEKESSK